MQIKVRLDSRLADRWAKFFTKQRIARAARALAPTLFALAFAGVAHAQGTMDFSGAQTLMGTFKTFAVYAGAVICFGGLIFAGIRMMLGDFKMRSQGFSVPECSVGEPVGSDLMRATFTPWRRRRAFERF